MGGDSRRSPNPSIVAQGATQGVRGHGFRRIGGGPKVPATRRCAACQQGIRGTDPIPRAVRRTVSNASCPPWRRWRMSACRGCC